MENGQRVYFKKDSNPLNQINNPPRTTLLAFFDLCKTDQFAKGLFYYEVPEYYVWDVKDKSWKRRKQGVDMGNGIKREHCIGRVYNVHPGNAECFFLRLLLHEVKGPTSFIDLKTFNGQIYSDFRSTCAAMGLLEDNQRWDLTMAEAVLVDMPKKLRELFAIILTFCTTDVANPLELWEKYKDHLSEDIQRRVMNNLHGNDKIRSILINLFLINKIHF